MCQLRHALHLGVIDADEHDVAVDGHALPEHGGDVAAGVTLLDHQRLGRAVGLGGRLVRAVRPVVVARRRGGRRAHAGVGAQLPGDGGLARSRLARRGLRRGDVVALDLLLDGAAAGVQGQDAEQDGGQELTDVHDDLLDLSFIPIIRDVRDTSVEKTPTQLKDYLTDTTSSVFSFSTVLLLLFVYIRSNLEI